MSIGTSRQKVAENGWIEVRYVSQIYEKKHKIDEILCCFHFLRNFTKKKTENFGFTFKKNIEIYRSQPIFVQL